MITHDFEDWLIGLSLLVAIAIPTAANVLKTPIAGEAFASASTEPQFKLTITAKRMPAECKGLDLATAPAKCVAYLNGETTMVMREHGKILSEQ